MTELEHINMQAQPVRLSLGEEPKAVWHVFGRLSDQAATTLVIGPTIVCVEHVAHGDEPLAKTLATMAHLGTMSRNPRQRDLDRFVKQMEAHG